LQGVSQLIVSTVEGRIRVRARRPKSAVVAASITRQVEGLEGVDQVRANPAAGSLVVSFDPVLMDTVALEDRLEALCLPPERAPSKAGRDLSRHLNRVTKVGMMATSLACGFLGNKKAHMGFGAAFVALAGAHMFR
jgi:hypothetical protein